MSHQQAFHTSCRTGLSGISGFQINAASAGLDGQQLAALASAHARYTAPHDLPYEPTAEDMRRFPVALKMSVVPAVGPVVSRTAYVGREYRGADGRPDEGRFGNYFCHMVVGAPGEEPFDGLNAVELWDADHWTTDEAPEPDLPVLGPLTPGPLELAAVVDTVTRAPAGVAAVLIDRALRALDGGSPLLIVDPDATRAVTWLAWITFALPPALARALTFSTFEGRPGDAANLHVVATTPACVSGTGGRFDLVDVTRAWDGDEPGLYARTAAALAQQDGEALTTAVRRVRGGTAEMRGALLAIAGARTDLVGDGDLPAMVAALLDLVAAGRVDEAATAADALPAGDADRAVIGAWTELHARVRACNGGDAARRLASIALTRMVAHVDALPADLAKVRPDAPTAPTVAGIGAWIRAAEAAAGTEDSGFFITFGVRCGLMGLNVPVDNRAAAVIARDLEREPMVNALEAVAATGALGHVIAKVAESVADAPPSDHGRRERLRALSRHPQARDAFRVRAERLGTFDAHAIWQRARVQSGSATPEDAARALAPLAEDSNARADIRELWGPRGPESVDELHALIRAYLGSGVPVPRPDRELAFQALMREPLPTVLPPADHIGVTLARFPEPVLRRADFWAWGSAVYLPGRSNVTLRSWAVGAEIAFHADGSVPDERWHELLTIVAATLVRWRGDPEFELALAGFRGPNFDMLCAEMGGALAGELHAAADPVAFAAREFRYWARLPGAPYIEVVLPVAFEGLSARDVERVVEHFVDPRWTDFWNSWADRHPRTKATAKVARAIRRLGRDRPEVGA
jgi:hypothetical protein